MLISDNGIKWKNGRLMRSHHAEWKSLHTCLSFRINIIKHYYIYLLFICHTINGYSESCLFYAELTFHFYAALSVSGRFSGGCEHRNTNCIQSTVLWRWLDGNPSFLQNVFAGKCRDNPSTYTSTPAPAFLSHQLVLSMTRTAPHHFYRREV